jgi:hypothetical protein
MSPGGPIEFAAGSGTSECSEDHIDRLDPRIRFLATREAADSMGSIGASLPGGVGVRSRILRRGRRPRTQTNQKGSTRDGHTRVQANQHVT